MKITLKKILLFTYVFLMILFIIFYFFKSRRNPLDEYKYHFEAKVLQGAKFFYKQESSNHGNFLYYLEKEMELPANTTVTILTTECYSSSYFENFFNESDKLFFKVFYKKQIGYIELKDVDIYSVLSSTFVEDFIYEYEYILNYTNIKPLDYLLNVAIREGKNSSKKNIDSESAIYACEYYLKKTNDFETLLDIILKNIKASDSHDLYDQDFMVSHYSDYFGNDRDSIYTLALKYNNYSVFKYLFEKYIIKQENYHKEIDEAQLYYKNKAGKSIFDYLLSNPDEFKYINELIFEGFDDKIYCKYDLEQYYYPDYIELRRFEDTVYLLKNCELMTPYNLSITLDKATEINVKHIVYNVALDGKDGQKYGLYYVSTENGIGGFLSSEYFVKNLVKVENLIESDNIVNSYFFSEHFLYNNPVYNSECDLVQFYEYDKDGNRLEKIVDSVVPRPSRIIYHGTKEINGKVYTCLEFRDIYYREVGELLEYVWFILYDEKKNEGHIVFRSDFDNYLKYDEFSHFQPSKIEWKDSVILVEGDDYDRRLSFVQEIHLKFTALNDFYYQIELQND